MRRWGVLGVAGTLLIGACASSPPRTTGPPEDATAYRVVYLATDDPEVVEERLVRRPYEARAVTRRGDRITEGRLTNLDGSWIFTTGATPGWLLLQTGPQRASPDPRPGAVLPRALQAGLAEERGAGEVLGRPCSLVRFGVDLTDDLDVPTADDHVEVCIDEETGIVLSDERVVGGQRMRSVVATELDTEPEIADDAFAVDEEVPSPGGMAVADELSEERLEEGLRVMLDPPLPYAYDGVSSKLVLGGSFGGQMASGVVQRYLDGDELLELDHAPPRVGGGRATELVEIEGIGRATRTLSLEASVLDVPLGEGVAVRLRAADPELLLEAARGLRVRS